MSTSDVAAERLIKRLRTQSWERYKSLQPNQRSYVNALAFAVLYLLFEYLNWEMYKGVLALAVLFWGMAMVADLLGLYKAISETLLGKLFFVAAFALGANVAVATAGQIVNGLVGVDPGKFVHTIAFTSLLVAPPLLLFLSIVALFVGIGLLSVFLMFQWLPDENSRLMLFPWYKPKDEMRYRGITALVQVGSFIAIGTLAYEWSQGGQTGYTEFMESRTKWFLYSFEMFEKAPCPLESGQRVAFLEGDQVLVASKVGEEISFALQECKAGIGSR